MKNKLSNIMTILVILFLAFVTYKSMAVEFDVKSFLDKTHVKIGMGYKVHEKKIYYTQPDGTRYLVDNPISARIEISYQLTKRWTIGYAHHSQWLAGYPFNDKKEYSKDEIFIDYTFSLGDL